jgi:hypothetical protein
MEKYRQLLQEFPLRLRANKSKGRFIVSTKDALPGELLLEEIPNSFVVFKDYAQQFCQHCLQKIETNASGNTIFGVKKHQATITCTECRGQSFWCSLQCKEADETHKKCCKYLIELPGIAGAASADYNLVRLMLNILVRKQLEKEIHVNGTPYSCVSDLVSHHKSFSAKFKNAMELASIDIVEMFLGSEIDITIPELVKLACRINSNSHAVHDPSGDVNAPIGVGMFPLVAMLNHSCTPNAAFTTTKSGGMQVRAVKPIASGEEVCVSYVDLFAPKWERQGTLLSSKFFFCECSRCKSEDKVDQDEWMDSIKCIQCSKGYIFRSSLTCNACAVTISQSTFQGVLENLDLQSGLDLYKAGLFDSALIQLLDTAKKAEELLHPHHHLLLTIFVNLISLYSRLNKFQEASKYCTKSIELMKLIATDAKMGLFNMELANLYDKNGELLEIIAEAKKAGLIEDEASYNLLMQQSKEQYQQVNCIKKILYG